MKKIMSLLVVFALMATMLVTTAFAAETVVTVGNATAEAGEEVTIVVKMTGNPGFAAANFELVYDETALSLLPVVNADDAGSIKAGALLANAVAVVNNAEGILSLMSVKNITGDGELFKVTFVVAEGASGTIPVSVRVNTLANEDDVDLASTVVAGSITVKAVHVHSYTKAGTTAPTCTEKGYTTYQCECGDSYRDDYVDALGHKYSAGETIAPTCTEQGSTRYTCSVCGHSYQDNYVDALGHKYSKPVFSWAEDYSDCTVSYSCTVCSKEFTEKCQVTSETTPATEKATGKIVYTVTFTLDGQTYTDTKTVVLPKLEPTPGTDDPEPQPEPGVTPDNSSTLYLIIGLLVAGIFILLFLLLKKKKKEETAEGK